ncbi:MAG: hypothetical protein HOD64_01610 [Candidatus Cloacimonetes bacterium]|nr:hypothetical protein [Candidatus Cloacimonadota bacterium]
MSVHTPTDYLAKLQKIKYRAAIFPILLVFASFGINIIFEIDQAKYLSIIGLLWYLLIIMRFRISRNHLPESKNEILLSPIYGKIVKIDGNIITIKKGIFQPADLRYSGHIFDVEIKSKQIKYFEDQPHLAGKLFGVVSTSALCICTIPNGWKINAKFDDKVVSGETILAEK